MYKLGDKIPDNFCEDHKGAIKFCIKNPNPTKEQFIEFYETEMLPHFNEEETISFPKAIEMYPKSAKEVDSILEDHAWFYCEILEIKEAKNPTKLIANFMERIVAHINKEEGFWAKYNTENRKFLYGGSINFYGNEIDDSEYSWKVDTNFILKNIKKKFRLNQIINHEQLFLKYPKFKNIPITFGLVKDEKIAGDSYLQYVGKNYISSKIYVNLQIQENENGAIEKYNLQSERPECSKEAVLLHEIQHLCQLADGRSVGRSHEELHLEYVRTRQDIGHIDRIDLVAYYHYKLQPSEQEAMKVVYKWLNYNGLEYKEKNHIIWEDNNVSDQQNSQEGLYKKGGSIPTNSLEWAMPSKVIYNYAKKIKIKYPYIWELGGNIRGNQSFKDLEKVINRGYWLDSERDFYVKWQSFIARHQHDFRIAGVVANLKWLVYPNIGEDAVKELINENIKTEFKQGGNILLAPNGKKSNLTSVQYKLVRTPEFISWFGDWENSPKNSSKVIDENGEPLVVYHGSSSFKKFYIFSNSCNYFSEDRELSELYSKHREQDFIKKNLINLIGNRRVFTCFLNIRNPKNIDANYRAFDDLEIDGQIKTTDQICSEFAKNKNYDGIKYDNIWDAPVPYEEYPYTVTNYVAFHSNQIKLADGTNTVFDGSNPDIRFEKGGQLDDNELNKQQNELFEPISQGINREKNEGNSRNEEVAIQLRRRIKEAYEDSGIMQEKYKQGGLIPNKNNDMTQTELNKAESDLHKAEKLQEMMKEANAIIRSKKNVTERLVKEAGLSEANAIKIQEPDFAGRIGFAQYSLTNNNASIKRLKDRVNMLKTKVKGAESAAKGNEERYTFNGGEIEINYPIDRVQILFPSGRTSKEMYATLRKNGYVYSPTNKAFQRKITPQAISNSVYLMKAKKVVGEQVELEKQEDLSVSDYSRMLEDRNFSYVSGNIYNAIPKGYKGSNTFELVYFDLLKPNVIEGVKAYFKEHLPEVDADKITINIYPKTYIKESKDLFSSGLYLPNNNSFILGPMVKQVKNFIAMENDTERFNELRYPELPSNHPLNILDKESPQYKSALKEYELEKGIAVEQEHKSTFEQLAAGKITPAQAVVETAKEHISEDPNYYDKLEGISNKGYDLITQKEGVELTQAQKIAIEAVNILLNSGIAGVEVEGANKLHTIYLKWPIHNMEMAIDDNKSPVATGIFVKRNDNSLTLKLSDIVGATNFIKKQLYEINSEEVLEPNSPEEFDEIIMDAIDPPDDWKGNLIKERMVKGQINQMLNGPQEDKDKEVERIFQLYAAKDKSNREVHELHKIKELEPMKKEKTLGQTSGGFIVEYADVVPEIINELASQGRMSESEAKDILVANKELSKEKYGLGLSSSQIAKAILAKANIIPEKLTDEMVYNNAIDVKAELNDALSKLYAERDFNVMGGNKLVVEDITKKILSIQEKEKELDEIIKNYSSIKPIEAHKETHTTGAFKGVNFEYKNQYELNKAIEGLLEQKGESHTDYTSDEKNFLRKYSGYGGLDKYGKTGKGGLFEYYTPRDVIEKMWALAYKYSYNNGSVLEPSVATGEFFQFAKDNIRKVGYEINSYSARICKILYPTAEILLQPFEKLFIKNNWTVKDRLVDLEKFDLVIGNPPYGDFSIVESRYMSGMGEKDHTKARNYVEYFIRRGLDLVKPGGLLIYIVGAQLKNGGNMFLDSGNTPVKEYLATNCELLDAYRLPDSVFERTGVTSDIIVLRKNG